MRRPVAFTLRLLLAAGLALGVAPPAHAIPAAAAPGGDVAPAGRRAPEPVAVLVALQTDAPATTGLEGKIDAPHTSGAGMSNTMTDGISFYLKETGDLSGATAFLFEHFHDTLGCPSRRNAPASTWRAPFGG